MGSSSSSSPAAPDYSPITTALSGAATEESDNSQSQYDWAKGEYAQNKGTSDQVVSNFLDTQQKSSDLADEETSRYENVFQPQEDALINDANSYASDARKDQEMGRAQAGVAQQFDQSRQNAQSDLESYGINPAATRYGALDIGSRSQQAAAEAGAGNQASLATDATARGLRSEAINIGRGYGSQIASADNTALQAGTGAVNAGNATTSVGSSTMGSPTSWATLGNSSLGTWGNTLNQSYNNQSNTWKNDQSASSGLGTAVGAGVSLASAFMAKGGAVGDDEDYKKPYVDHHVYVIPTVDESGRHLTPEQAMHRYHHTGDHLGIYPSMEAAHAAHATPEQRQDYEKHMAGGGDVTSGGNVPDAASPSGGKAVDDVDARLTSGEFVIPKQAVEWYGHKHLYGLIEKADKERSEAKQTTGAVPEYGPSSGASPKFVSRSAVG